MMVQPSPPIPHKEQEVRLRATETSSPPLASAPKAPRRERIAQPPPRHSEKPTTPSKKEVSNWQQCSLIWICDLFSSYN